MERPIIVYGQLLRTGPRLIPDSGTVRNKGPYLLPGDFPSLFSAPGLYSRHSHRSESGKIERPWRLLWKPWPKTN